MVMSKLMLVAMVVVLGAAPVSAAPAAKCVFRKSCTKRLFHCFQVKGTCRQDAQVASTSACWDNGAKVTQEFGTGGTLTVLGKKAKPCVVGTVQRGPNGEFQVSWTRKNKTVLFSANADGTRSFTCPNGKVETYSATDFRAGQVCGHIPSTTGGAAETCAPGTCP